MDLNEMLTTIPSNLFRILFIFFLSQENGSYESCTEPYSYF